MRKIGFYLIIAVFAISTAFTSCEKNKDDKNNDNGNGNENLKEWVVINGVKWAGRNVGAPGTFVAKPEDAGMFYQWNRKKGWAATGNIIDWDSSMPVGDTWTKANNPCPAGWRVPTKEEFESLLRSGSTWGKLNGVTGRFFGSGEDKIFFPAAGRRGDGDGTLDRVGSDGNYWTSTANGSFLEAWELRFHNENANIISIYRRWGCSVRCVAE